MVTLTSQMAVGVPTPMPTPGVEKGEMRVGDEGREKRGADRPEMERFETAKEGFT